VGPLHVQSTEQTGHVIPPLLADGALALGVILIGVGVMRGRPA
jgi:hypothetical protein